jgi:hypothetical protein
MLMRDLKQAPAIFVKARLLKIEEPGRLELPLNVFQTLAFPFGYGSIVIYTKTFCMK